MNRTIITRTTAGLSLSLMVLLAGCAPSEEAQSEPEPTASAASETTTESPAGDVGDEPEPGSAGSASQSGEPSASATTSASASSEASGAAEGTGQENRQPGVEPVDNESLQGTAEDYLNARENQMSYQHEKPLDWLDDVKPLMTQEAFAELEESTGGGEGVSSGGNAWAISHEEGLAVQAEVGECGVDMAAGLDEPDSKMVRCPVTDVVVDEDGDPVPSTEIPSMWPYVGPQRPAVLHMVREDGQWKVQMDATGLAS